MPNQIAQSGVLPDASGHIIEYFVDSPTLGRPVEFDNFVTRGAPPVPVFQEFKGDYSFINKPKMPEAVGQQNMNKWVAEAQGQLTAIADAGLPNARLECFISTSGLDEQFLDALSKAGVPDGAIRIYRVPLGG